MNYHTEESDIVSVLVLTYNSCSYLTDVLLSIEKQIGCKKEVIVCDDGSNEGVLSEIYKIVAAFKNSDTFTCRVKANKVNQGTVKNINAGIADAHGTFIKIIAADDIFPNVQVFARQIKKMKETGRQVIVGKYCNCNENLEPMEDIRATLSNSFLDKIKEFQYDEGERIIRRNNLFPIATQAWLINREFFYIHPFNENYKLVEDVEFSKCIRKNASCYEVVDMVSVFHRCNVGVSSKNNVKKHGSHVNKDYLLDCRRVKSSDYEEIKGIIAKTGIRNEIKYIDYLILKNEDKLSMFTRFKYSGALLYHYITSLVIRVRQAKSYMRLKKDQHEIHT